MNTVDRYTILTQTAQHFIGTVDKLTIEKFQQTTTGRAIGQSWCLDFVVYCVKQVLISCPGLKTALPATELVTNLWEHSPARQRYQEPRSGYIVVWNRLGTIHGHCGIVTDVFPDYFRTIEGNTSQPVPPNTVGVWQKMRLRKALRPPKPGDFVLMGFLDPFT